MPFGVFVKHLPITTRWDGGRAAGPFVYVVHEAINEARGEILRESAFRVRCRVLIKVRLRKVPVLGRG